MRTSSIARILATLVLSIAVTFALGPVTMVSAQEEGPTEVPFGDAVVGEPAGEPLRLFIESQRPDVSARVTGYTLVGPDAGEFSVVGLDESVTITGAEIHMFAVELLATSPGQKSAEILVDTSLSDGTTDQERYILSAFVSPADEFEPNDEPATATPIETGVAVDAATVGNDVDHFSIGTTRGQSVTVTVENRGVSPVFYLVAASEGGVLSDEVELAGGESETVTLEMTQDRADLFVVVGNVYARQTLESGQQYDVVVPYSVTVAVEGGEEPTPTPVPSGTGATATETQTETPPPSVTGQDGPGFGVVAVVVAVALVALLLARRR